jgi:hypothetical protein
MNSKTDNVQRITIGELIDHLKVFDKDSELIFGSDELTFYRTKNRGEKIVQIEFNEQILDGKIIK